MVSDSGVFTCCAPLDTTALSAWFVIHARSSSMPACLALDHVMFAATGGKPDIAVM